MLSRRAMVQSAPAFSVWPSLHPFASLALQKIPSAVAPDDQSFWASVRSQLEIAPEFNRNCLIYRNVFHAKS